MDLATLKPGECVLKTLERNGFTCQQCGSAAGDPDPYNAGRKVRLHVDYIIPISQGGTDDRDNLKALCSTCNQGKQNIQAPSETALNILARIRKLPRSHQKEVYETLKRSFPEA